MVKKILKVYLISLIILVLFTFLYSIYLYFSQNLKYFNLITFLIGALFFITFSFLLGKIYNKKIFLIEILYFFINILVIYIVLKLTNYQAFKFDIVRSLIYLLLSIFMGFLSRKK